MSHRIDRKTALRRAAAPSIDFSLLPAHPAVQELGEEPAVATPANTVRRWSPGPSGADASADAASARVAEGDRFAFPVRPGNHPTLQPFDAPMAAALAAGEDRTAEHLDHPLAVPRNPSGRRSMDLVELVAAIEAQRAPARVAPVTRSSAPVRIASPTLKPELEPVGVVGGDDPFADALIDASPVPRTARYSLHGLARDCHPTVIDDEEVLPPGWALEEADDFSDDFADDDTIVGASPADEEVDGELNDWMRRRTRARFFALAGSGAIMTLLTAVAIAGVWVTMGRPVIEAPPAPAPVEEVAVAPAAPQILTVTVQRGDTFHKLLSPYDLDVGALVAAAKPVHDMGRLEVGDQVKLVVGAESHDVEQVRYALDAARTLVLSRKGDGWSASVERSNS